MSIIRNGALSADLDAPVTSPTLNLDFANSQSLDSRITFIRGGIGTRVNKNGLIETLSANQPRFDYDPISGECKGLLIEESRTNMLTYSIPSSGTWSSINTDITSNSIISPDGTQNASLVKGSTTALSTKYINLNSSITSGQTYTQTFFVKAGTTNYVQIAPSTGFSSNYANFELIGNGRIGNSTVSSAFIQAFPNGWYRIGVTETATSTVSGRMLLSTASSLTSTRLPSIIPYSFYVWGAQLELGVPPSTFPASYASSYIPTSGSTVTRNPDLVSIEGTKFSSWYNQTEGTFLYNGTLPFVTNDPTSRVMYGVSNGFSFSNSIYAIKPASSLAMSINVIGNNVNQSPLGGSLPNMTSSKIKIASSVSPNNIYSCGDGKAVVKTSRPSAFIPTVTKLTLGREPWNSSPQNTIIGCISKFTYYPKALSPAELQYLTS